MHLSPAWAAFHCSQLSSGQSLKIFCITLRYFTPDWVQLHPRRIVCNILCDLAHSKMSNIAVGERSVLETSLREQGLWIAGRLPAGAVQSRCFPTTLALKLIFCSRSAQVITETSVSSEWLSDLEYESAGSCFGPSVPVGYSGDSTMTSIGLHLQISVPFLIRAVKLLLYNSYWY